MATVANSTRTSGSILASQRFDAAVADGLAERPPRYPQGASFIGADVPYLSEILAREAREGRHVVLVYPDGEEWIMALRRPVGVPELEN